jgi:1-acylglycerone phosphate reductase
MSCNRPYVFGSAYNASKAALHAYSDTLRVELAPFDVKVVIVVTGGVKSQIARIDRVLNEDSIYLPLEADYIRRTKHSQEVGMPAEKYAKTVVGKLLGWGPPQRIWAGYGVMLVWFASTFLPRSVMVRAEGFLTNRGLLNSRRTCTSTESSTCGSWRSLER